MKKWCLFFLLFLLLIVICFISYLHIYRAEFASNALTRLYGVPVTIEKIDCSSDGLTLKNMVIYSPKECSIQTAFSVKTIKITATWKELCTALFGNNVASIQEIEIESPLFGIELMNADGSESNWKSILTHLAQNGKKNVEMRRGFHVNKAVLKDVSLQVVDRARSARIDHPASIEKIEMGQLSSAHAVTLDQIVYGITKMALVQIGQSLGQKGFTQSIQDVPPLM